MKKSYIIVLLLAVLIGCAKNNIQTKTLNSAFLYEKEMNRFEWYDDELKYEFIQLQFPSDNKPNKHLFEIGGRLLRDDILSSTTNYSCVSCHNPKHNFADSVRFSQNYKGKPTFVNTPTLTNLQFHNFFGLEAKESSLENFLKSHLMDKAIFDFNEKTVIEKLNTNKSYLTLLENSGVQKEYDASIISKALGQYVRSIVSFKTAVEIELREKNLIDLPDTAIMRYYSNKYGEKVFNAMKTCYQCHTSLAWGGDKITNNGLLGFDKNVKVPSIKNVQYSGPYMHDGRFATLYDVVNFYNEQTTFNTNIDAALLQGAGQTLKLGLNEQEKKQLVAFLIELTDKDFIKQYAK
jgi:cytochrome c peroxidase